MMSVIITKKVCARFMRFDKESCRNALNLDLGYIIGYLKIINIYVDVNITTKTITETYPYI